MLSCCLKTDLWLCWCWLVLLFKVKLYCRRDPSCRPCFSSDCRRISVGNNLKSHILSDFWSFHSFRCLGTGTAGWSYRPHGAESQMGRRRLTTAAAISDQQVHQKNHQMCSCSLQDPSWEPAWFPPAAALRWWLRFHCVLECTSAFSSSSLLTSSSHLEALSADSASELWRCCCRGSHHLHFLVFCAQASSYAFGKAEFWPWNFVFPFLFLIATLYVLLMRLFQVIRLISDTFINLWFWE